MDMRKLTRVVFTLKNGQQVRIYVDKYEPIISDGIITLKGYDATPLIVEKTLIVKDCNIAATEIITEQHLTWTMTNESRTKVGRSNIG
jgi:hypothetical protein